MLTELRIHNLGVISDATLEPCPGMTVVTGETGAGKTMVVSGLGLLLGARADTGAVRRDADRTLVEGRFTGTAAISEALDEIGAEIDDDELIVSRQVTSQGRSRANVGGVQVPMSRLAQLTGELATIHGQSGQIRLSDVDRQREVLDQSGGAELAGILARYREVYAARAAARHELDELHTSEQERARRADMLRFGISEIDDVAPEPGEDVELASQSRKLQAVDELRGLAERARHALSGSDEGDPDDPGAIGLAGIARQALENLAGEDDAAAHMATTARDLASIVNDLAADVASYLADLEADPLALETVTARRAQLAALTRKYGDDIDEVLSWRQSAAEELEDLDSSDERIAELRDAIAVADTQIAELGGSLSAARRKAADRLAAQVNEELAGLSMSQARLTFDLVELSQPGPWGFESVRIMLQANPGLDPAPLAKAASGGELSRVRLALEVVLAGSGHIFIFDEVDAGIGGAVALAVGSRLARLARSSQVIVVTHLAQVAAYGDEHWVVTKSSDADVTLSHVRRLGNDERPEELARMMSGEHDSDAALAHARELLDHARGDRFHRETE